MADYTSDRTGASIDTVLDNADSGNIGKTESANLSVDVNTLQESGFYRLSSTSSNIPLVESATLLVCGMTSGNQTQTFTTRDTRSFIRGNSGGTWGAWQELYHTGNTANVGFNESLTPSDNKISIGTGSSDNVLSISASETVLKTIQLFQNGNGLAGTVKMIGTSTQYNTSSDPRLKDFKAAPTDTEVNAKFDDLFGCFKTFNWKNDPTGDIVWGFDAHATIDAGLDMGSEGEGSRDLALGDVYKTDEAELDEDGVEIKAAIEHKVSPAGVDQSKAVPILLAKIEQLERRLKAAGI